ncbi:GntR family transcriptional regulator [Planctomicrobium sp. SH661]|uniref:GntR family transcriptional regulator n=1 Tax=Planctomicrobium sp. SH661 TaxID=3448124 RepID=UPI003F5C2923
MKTNALKVGSFDQSLDVVGRLRLEILSGRIPEGARLTEAEISKRYQVGRGPAREAVQRLSTQGLLLTRPNCGAVVAPVAPKETRGVLLTVRRTLEVHALEQIFEDLTPADFEHWEKILEQMRQACEAEDFHAIAEMDIAFHHHLLVCAKEPDLLMIWELLVGRIRSHFRRTQRRRCANVMDLYDEHRLLLETFRTGTLAEATELLKEKID